MFDWRKYGSPMGFVNRLTMQGVKQPTKAERKKGIVAHFRIKKDLEL